MRKLLPAVSSSVEMLGWYMHFDTETAVGMELALGGSLCCMCNAATTFSDFELL